MGIHKLSAVSTAAIILLFLAICAYLGADIYACFDSAFKTEVLRPVSVKDSLELNGIAVRREQLVCSPSASELLPGDGKRIPAGAVYVFDSQGNKQLSSDSAVFYEQTDGFEYLKPEDFEGLDTAHFRELLKSEPEKTRSCGKLVCCWDWYFAAICKYSPGVYLNAPCKLEFPGSPDSVQGRIVSLSSPDKGELTLLIRLTRSGDDLMRLRKTEAKLILSDYSGLRIPEQALHRDSEGNEFVYTLTAGKKEKQTVEIIYKSPGSFIAAASEGPEGLHAGSRIIISG